jgi:hypothetical protein
VTAGLRSRSRLGLDEEELAESVTEMLLRGVGVGVGVGA